MAKRPGQKAEAESRGRVVVGRPLFCRYLPGFRVSAIFSIYSGFGYRLGLYVRETRSTGGVAVILCRENPVLRARCILIGCWVGAWLCLNAALAGAQQLPAPRSGQPPLTPTVIDQAAAGALTTGWAGPTGDFGAAWTPYVTPTFPAAPSTTGGGMLGLPAQSPTSNQSRTDSTVTGIRPLTNWSNPANGQDLQSIPVRTSLGETANELGPLNPAESQQGAGWAGLPNPQLSGGNPRLPPLNPAGVGQYNPPNSNASIPTLPLSGGESLATGDRLLATDQMNRQRAPATIPNRQSQIAAWDTGIALPEFNTGTGLRQGRPVRPGGGAEEAQILRDTPQFQSPQFQSPPIPSSQTAGATREPSDEVPTDADTTSRSRADKSMDQFSWWLMMCSVLANAILFYFLYDSRAKYLDLADELQARFFRER